MYCPNCSSPVPNGIDACPNCGAKIPAQQNYNEFHNSPTQPSPPLDNNPFDNANNQVYYNPEPFNGNVDPGEGIATATFVLGILSLVGGGLVTAIIALVLGSEYKTKGNGMNEKKVSTGVLLSKIAIGLFIGVIALYVILLALGISMSAATGISSIS